MKRILSAVAAAALGLGLLTACGNDSGSSAGGGDYCADLKSAKTEVDAIKSGDLKGIEKTVDTMHQLADEAPSEVKDDWKTLVDGVDKVVVALKKAGLDDQDIASLQSGQVPDGVDITALTDLMNELKALNTPDIQKAGAAINKHAKDSCGVDLGA